MLDDFIPLSQPCFGLIDDHKPNPALQASLQMWVSHSEPNDILITAGDLVPELLYWEKRSTTVNLYRTMQIGRDSSTANMEVHEFEYDLYRSLPPSQRASGTFSYLKWRINTALCRGDSVLLAPAVWKYYPEDRLFSLQLPRLKLKDFLESYYGTELFSYTNLTDGQLTSVIKILGPMDCAPVAVISIRN